MNMHSATHQPIK